MKNYSSEIISILKHEKFNQREKEFIYSYYGLSNKKALTLDTIGKKQSLALTRERVRQIIDNAILKMKKYSVRNIFDLAYNEVIELLGDKKFLSSVDILKLSNFVTFNGNIKGLICFLNDCGIKQISYRGKFYFYNSKDNRLEIVALIQNQNKIIRRNKTIEKMELKDKTVTYVPTEIKEFLSKEAGKQKINLNHLYENIFILYMSSEIYKQNDYQCIKTKSWKARKGTSDWQQIGIYVDKDILGKVKSIVSEIKAHTGKSISLMGFICHSFIWFAEKNNVTL